MLFKKLNTHNCVICLAKLFVVTLGVLSASGCGQSGDLSLPQENNTVQYR